MSIARASGELLAGGDVIRNFGGWVGGGTHLPLDTSTQQGVIYHIGTAGGTAEFANPAGTEITVSVSGTGSGSSNNLTDRTSSDWYAPNVPGGWIKIDLGVSRLLLPEHVAFRQRSSASTNLARKVRIQGSNDDSTWTWLWSVENGYWVSGQGAWEYAPLAMLEGTFRYFRLLQYGTDSSGTNYFCCTEVELFGELVV